MLGSARIAVTGGLSCGKSSLSQFLADCGAYVVRADSIVHQLLEKDRFVQEKVICLFGPNILLNGVISRPLIAHSIFAQPSLLPSFEKIIHPIVYERIEAEYSICVQKDNPPALFVAELPLLFEGGEEKRFDATVAIVAPEERTHHWFLQRGGEEIAYRFWSARQLHPIEKGVRADYIILNLGTLNDLEEIAHTLYRELCSLPRQNTTSNL